MNFKKKPNQERENMTLRQQAIMTTLNKICRQYFLYDDKRGMDHVKIRLRSDIHRVEEADRTDIELRLIQRTHDHKIGQLNPKNLPYEPVSGWPFLNLDDLVLNAMSDQLDPKAWQAFRTHHVKTEIKKHEKSGDAEYLKDLSTVHSCPNAGYDFVKTHLAESDERVKCVKAGIAYEKHFIDTWNARLMRENIIDADTMKTLDDSPEFVMAKERVRNDTVLFLKTLMDLLEKMLLLRTRHLKSHTPVCLAVLGTGKDYDKQKTSIKVAQYPGLPPVQHNFRDQILIEAPEAWPVKTPLKSVVAMRQGISRDSSFRGLGVLRSRSALPLRAESDVASLAKRAVPFVSHMFDDPEMCNRFRKRWPPVWMSMASWEQGCYFVDPQCPTREYNACLGPHPLQKKKSMSSILETRRNWAQARSDISKATAEQLWRVDKEKLDAYKVQFGAMRNIRTSMPYETLERHVVRKIKSARRKRQKVEIYDYELTKWYKYLVEQMYMVVGDEDKEINELLSSIKIYFKLSATSPKFGKAKLALITMSLPATSVLLIHVQRALLFILNHVLEAPEPLLIGWLAARGLPFLLLKHQIL